VIRNRMRLDVRLTSRLGKDGDLGLRLLWPAHGHGDLGRGFLCGRAALAVNDPGLDDEVAQLACDRGQAIGREARQGRLDLRSVRAAVELAEADHARIVWNRGVQGGREIGTSRCAGSSPCVGDASAASSGVARTTTVGLGASTGE